MIKLNTDKDKPLLLALGDFSGIQETVYTISSKGALKSLCARSFMLLTEHIVYEIMRMAGKITPDTPANYLIRLDQNDEKTKPGVICSGGGRVLPAPERESRIWHG